jgi:hypothetical protein
LPLQLRDIFLQARFALGEGLDLARFNLAFEIHSAELGNPAVENA